MADDSGAPVAYLRTIEDSQRLKESFGEGRSVVVIGGGWIGLEVTAAAREAGSAVTVLESLDLPLLRVLGPEVGRDLRRPPPRARRRPAHRRPGRRRSSKDGDGGPSYTSATAARSRRTSSWSASAWPPTSSLAEAAGIETDNGVLVDERLRTSDPDVYAVGDIANHAAPGARPPDPRRALGHRDRAGRDGGRTRCSAHDITYDRLPYFFTDQYDLGMEYVGSVGPDGYDEVVLRGDTKGRTFTAFWLQGGRVVAGMHVNDWDATDHIRAIVGKEISADRLRNEDLSLEELAGG